MKHSSTPHRLAAVDALRGLVMALMALDHVREFFSADRFDPTDLERTTAALFLTRWITHFCAPVFVFLAGVSAYLYGSRLARPAALTGMLLKRGAQLILIQLTLETLAWNFLPDWRHIEVGVLWAIGWSMLVLAGLVRLPLAMIAGFGVVMILAHNLGDGITAAALGDFGPWWAVLHTGETVALGAGWTLQPYYPLVPWIGVMAAGYGFGPVLRWPVERRRQVMWSLGGTMVLAFMLLRYSGGYGDPRPWQVQADSLFSLLAFLNCQKYPPSLLYLLMTLGPALMVLAVLERRVGSERHLFIVLGRVPLFFYVLHLYVIHVLAVAAAALSGDAMSTALTGPWLSDTPPDYGYSLPVVYLVWIGVLLVFYPLCRWYRRLWRH